MDTQPDDSLEIANKAVNVGRRSLLGRATTGGIAVASVGAMGCWAPRGRKQSPIPVRTLSTIRKPTSGQRVTARPTTPEPLNPNLSNSW